MVTKALLDVSLEGIGKLHRTPVFPCGIFSLKDGINTTPDTPNYDLYRLALKSTAKRLYPNYYNCDWSPDVENLKIDRENKQKILDSLSTGDYEKLLEYGKEHEEDFKTLGLYIEDGVVKLYQDYLLKEIPATMGCRTVNARDINFDGFEKNIKSIIQDSKPFDLEFVSSVQRDGRGNICPVTIILPTLAMMAREELGLINDDGSLKYDISEVSLDVLLKTFFDILDAKLQDARDMLVERFNLISSQSAKSAKFMYENRTMCGYIEDEGIVSALKHGTLAIGELGLAECLQILIGCDHTSIAGMKLAKQIEQLYSDRCNEFKKETGLNIGVYYSPAENLCKTAMTKFKEKYGVIPNVSENKFFTNSMHVPVWKEMDPFEKIDVESQLTGYSRAGCITYVELRDSILKNLDALEQLVDYAKSKDIPYYAINVPNDTCLDCGFTGEIPEDGVCPVCGSDRIERLRRVTGYLTGNYKTAFNEGKIQETEMRFKHSDLLKSGWEECEDCKS